MFLHYCATFSSLSQGWSWKLSFLWSRRLIHWGSFPFPGVSWHKPGHRVEFAGSSCCLSNGVSGGCADLLPVPVGLVTEGVTADLWSRVPPLLLPCSRREAWLLVFLTQLPATNLHSHERPGRHAVLACRKRLAPEICVKS